MEIVEQDTGDSEDIPNLLEFLLPESSIVAQTGSFGITFNRRLFNGWVKQPSACCGAAAVAGAWNGLLNFHRTDAQSINHIDVLRVYMDIFADMIDKKQSAFERKLGAKLDPFIESLDLELRAVGREIGGKKGTGATKKIVLDIVMKLCSAHFSAANTTSATANSIDPSIAAPSASDVPNNVFTQRSAVECFVELLQAEGYDFATAVDPIVPDAVKEEAAGSDNEVCNVRFVIFKGMYDKCPYLRHCTPTPYFPINMLTSTRTA